MGTMKPIDPSRAVRGQFEGYRDEPGVSPHSNIETFVALELTFNSERWHGVPFYLRAGKCLPVTCTEVLVSLRPSPHAAPSFDGSRSNYVRFRLTPDGVIALGVHVKVPGDDIIGQDMELIAHEQPAGEESPYERLLLHASQGDKSVFVSENRVEEAWRVVDQILDLDRPAYKYQQGTWGPREADRVLERGEHWHNPTLQGTVH
jgi:glucose-6-phosphate 1-dehydrogenase